ISACRSSIARARSATRSEKLGTARDGCFGRRESDLIPNRIFTSSTDSGVWCRSSTSKGNCCITSGGREPGPNSFNCRPDLISTTTIASMLWIPLTGACRVFNTTVPRSGGREETTVKPLLSLAFMFIVAQSFAQVQPTVDALGMHNLTLSSGASVYSQGSLGCTFCHAPHSGLGGNTPLWNQKLSQKSYVPYSSTTDPNLGNTHPPLVLTSSLCLSCHDGTVGVGQSAAYGQLPTIGALNSADSFGTTLTGSHPFSLVMPLKDASNLVASLVTQGKTADPTGAVKLISGNIECTSCHDPHIQSKDRIAQNFLVRDSSNAQMCLACHDPTRVVQGQINPLAGFTNSIHQTATN